MNSKTTSASAVFAALLAMSSPAGADTGKCGFVAIDKLSPEDRARVKHAFAALTFDDAFYVMGMDEAGPVLMPRKDARLEPIAGASGTGGTDGPVKDEGQ